MSLLVRRALDRAGLLATAEDVRARLRYLRFSELRAKNEALIENWTRDEYPLPPPGLVYAVAGHFDVSLYVESGAYHAEFIRARLESAGVDLEGVTRLLDFGCGCGRVLRHWHALRSTDVCGSDLSPKLVAWCRRALPFASVQTNALEPPLPYASGSVEVVYAISVFTHLTEDLQIRWMRELERILAPGGVAIVTTKGLSRLDALTPAERDRFDAGELVVQAGRYAGRNLCAAFHPEKYIRGPFAGSLETLEVVPADGALFTQDATVFRKPG